MDYVAITTDNYLEHHGILGQKWGVRRYQNADGSLTEAGKKRQKFKDEDKYDMKDTFKNAAKTGAGAALAGTGIELLKDLAIEGARQYSIKSLATIPMMALSEAAKGYSLFTTMAPIVTTSAIASMPIAGLALGVAGTAGLVGTGAAMVKRYFKRHSENDSEKK